MNEVYEFLKKCGTYYLATIDGKYPRVRPFGTIDIFGGKLYFQTGKAKKVSEQIKENPYVEICAFLDGNWLRVSGEAVLDDNIEAQKHMLDQYPSLKVMYAPGDGNTEVFYLKNARAEFCSFVSPAKIIKF